MAFIAKLEIYCSFLLDGFSLTIWQRFVKVSRYMVYSYTVYIAESDTLVALGITIIIYLTF